MANNPQRDDLSPDEPLDLSQDADPAGSSNRNSEDDRAAQRQERTVEHDLSDLEGRCQELEAKLLRAHADYQNYVRRAQVSADHARQQQLMEVVKDLLTVLDHFDHALAVDASHVSAASLYDGLVIVRDELMRTLERYGVKRLTVNTGDEFDPNRHEAMMRQAEPGVESNRVVSQLQPGYLLGEKTLRPAKVSVAE